MRRESQSHHARGKAGLGNTDQFITGRIDYMPTSSGPLVHQSRVCEKKLKSKDNIQTVQNRPEKSTVQPEYKVTAAVKLCRYSAHM